MGFTLYSDIYDRFDNLMEDYKMDEIFQRDIYQWEAVCFRYLKSARTYFKQFKSKEGKRLAEYINDDMEQFDYDLSEDEQEILATLMLSSWLNKEVNNVLVLRPSLSDSDFKEVSKSQMLSLKLELKNQLSDDSSFKINEYTWYRDYIDNK